MWWGGGEGEPEGAATPQAPPETEPAAGNSEVAVVKQELGDLQDQFDQQQALIGQLKDMLKSKDSALSTREKEVEDYTARLAKLKPRLGRTSTGTKKPKGPPEKVEPMSLSEEVLGEEAAGALPVKVEETRMKPVEEKKLSSSESGSRAKILLLRKQLEENRLKFELQRKEDAEKRATMEEMKERIERLRTEVEQRDTVIESLQEGASPVSDESMTKKLYQQIVYKDNTIFGLTQKIERLEGAIQEQHERLSEKDKVIEARTEAVSLIAKAQDEKSLKTLEELEEVREQMKNMQKDFIAKEQEFLSEKESVMRELKEKSKKVSQLEENTRRLENLRFELSTRNAELQEKIVTLQSDVKSLRRQSEHDRTLTEEKDTVIQDLKHKLVKAEAHGFKKLKALEKQLKTIKGNGNAGEQILQLQNFIAELEEEKGNLQLKLVDFDDLKVANEKLMALRNKLEDQIKQLNNDLDSQLSAITLLETEKIKLVEGTNERENRIFDLEAELNVARSALEEATQAKVTLDLKLCEVEEQRDLAEKSKLELESQLDESKALPMEQLMAEKGTLEEALQSMEKERDDWEGKYQEQISTVKECEEKTNNAIKEMEVKAKECKRLINILTDKENSITTMSIKLDRHDAVVADIQSKLDQALAETEKKNRECEDVNRRLIEDSDKLSESLKSIEELKSQLTQKSSELQSRETELATANETMQTLNRNVNERNISIQNLVGEVTTLQDKVCVKERSIDEHINRLEQLESEVRKQDARMKDLECLCEQKEDQIGEKNAQTEKLKHQLDNTSKKLETMKSSLESELSVLSTMLSDAQNQITALNEYVEVKDKEIKNNQIIISKYEHEVCEKNQLLDVIQNEQKLLQEKVSNMEATLLEKERSLSMVQSELEEKLMVIESQNTRQATLEQRIQVTEEEKQTLAENKSRLEEEVSEVKSLMYQKDESLVNMNSEMVSKSHELSQDIEQLRHTLEEKQQEIFTLEASVGSLTSEIESKTRDGEKWQTEALEKTEQLATVTDQLNSVWEQVQEREVLVGKLQQEIGQQQQQLTYTQEELSQTHLQLQEVRELLSQKENRVSEIDLQLNDVQNQLTQTKETLDRTQAELNDAQNRLQETSVQSHCLTEQFEQQLHSKASSIEVMEKQLSEQKESSTKGMESVVEELKLLKSDVERLEVELRSSREYAENLEIGSSKVQEWASQLESELELVKGNNNAVTTELTTVKESLGSKEQRIEELQVALSQEQDSKKSLQDALNEAMSSQQQQQQRLESLQTELCHAHSLQQQSESEVANISLSQQQTISQLEGEILTARQDQESLQATLDDHINQLQNKIQCVSELSHQIDTLRSQITVKDEEIKVLHGSVLEEQNAKSSVEESLREALKLKEQLEIQLSALQSHTPDSVRDIGCESTQIQSIKEELATAQDQIQFLEEECDTLRTDSNTVKQQLQEARQTITQLQTSLATQTQGPVSSTPTWDEWGEVDLGTPEAQEMPQPESSLLTSLQKSLVDKDEMLMMIQDQLKDALQQINTLNEERKVLEQKQKSTESNYGQQKQQWEQDNEAMWSKVEELNILQATLGEERIKISELESQLYEKQKEIEMLQEQINNSNTSSSQPLIPAAGTISVDQTTTTYSSADQQQQDIGSQSATILEEQWTQVSASDSFVQSTPGTGDQDPISWFDQPAQQIEEPIQEEVAQQVSSVQQETTEEEVQAADAGNIEDLKYKLSWYEEQWGTWTGHYTQLQTSYQESQQQVEYLTQEVAQLTQQVAESTLTQSQTPDTEACQTTAEPDTQGTTTADIDVQKDTPPETIPNESKLKQQELEILDLQKTLEETQAMCQQLKENNDNIQQDASKINELERQLEVLTSSSADSSRLIEAETEVNRLRGFETQVYELQSQVQTLQYQCTAMQNKLAEAETERSRLHEVEVLYGELQSCIQESETKREGSNSRVQELELMVQSAESEISRLRNELDALNQASREVETDRERLETDAEGLGVEMSKLDNEVLRLQGQVKAYKQELERLQEECELCRNEKLQAQKEGDSLRTENLRLLSEKEKCQSDFEFCKVEAARLERENQALESELQGLRGQMQRYERENNQLRSELEVMEGEHGRLRGDYEILEGDNNRARSEYDALSQAVQVTEAEKESLESEIQRITAQNMTQSTETNRLRDEIQRLTEVKTSAESEIARLRTEIERFRLLDSQYSELEGKYSELQAQVASIDTDPSSKAVSETESYSLLEEVDWGAEGKIEDEHLRKSSSSEAKYLEEIDVLKNKLIALEKEKNVLYDEVQSAKMKSGKLLQKLKLTQNKNDALTKEVQKLKAKAGGFSDLDQALEEEWKAQVTRAEQERDELKQKMDEMESEKERLVNQVDVLTAAQEQYLDMKEGQDHTTKLLSARNKELESQVQALEWRLSELEEERNQPQHQDNTFTQDKTQLQEERVGSEVTTAASSSSSSDVSALREQISSLHVEVKALKLKNEKLQELVGDLEERIESIMADNTSFQSTIERLNEAKTKAEADVIKYKTAYIELDSDHTELKKEKDRANEELRQVTYTHDSLEAAYNSMFSEYNDLRDICDSHKHDIGIIKGERDRLVGEVDSLKKQLEALQEEEEEETIRALQEECFSLREQNNLLHEEGTALEVQAEDFKQKAARVSNVLEQNLEMQKLLRDELVKKSEEINFNNTTIEGQERQLAYLKAEIAAMKTKLTQYDQAEETSVERIEDLQNQVEQLQELNNQLQLQVETAESSLARLAGGSGSEVEGERRIPDLSTATTELEAALASLHLRDLRCQQLSLEITKLLEERDALQLKLSASLRQTQELSRELSLSHQLPAPVSPAPSLDQKLAELRELNDSLEQAALTSLQTCRLYTYSRSSRNFIHSDRLDHGQEHTPSNARVILGREWVQCKVFISVLNGWT
ncbi:hypothetical protein Pcinc_038050 [Petrolisthes cinctipes]|uniref:Uncharacterized protein n=1 Tax=Petrolisthes cinctipes TaxID=88211 RepID=A0AAE1EKR8_PETCI|nr:hypothetical protein Pcinc_038050 [Petrolisthes cinctipes]